MMSLRLGFFGSLRVLWFGIGFWRMEVRLCFLIDFGKFYEIFVEFE